MSSSDSTFSTLPNYLQRRIDRAFTSEAKQNLGLNPQSPPHKKRKLNAPTAPSPVKDFDSGGGFVLPECEPAGGGFILETSKSPVPGGGFIIEGHEKGDETLVATHIPLSSVPSALQVLDLPPDDEQVLSVFRNAASGWSSASHSHDDSDHGGLVSREDWRAVCAVLLEHHAEEYEDDEDEEVGDVEDEESEGGAEDDEYRDPYSPSEDSNPGSDDEYLEGPSASTSRRRTRTRRASPSPTPSSSHPKKLTTRQTQTCLEAFSLFFPSIPATSPELRNQRIMIKDIQRVAKVLGEKIKAEEMIEMLEAFSTSPDKTMNLSDFERMMIAAKLA